MGEEKGKEGSLRTQETRQIFGIFCRSAAKDSDHVSLTEIKCALALGGDKTTWTTKQEMSSWAIYPRQNGMRLGAFGGTNY